MCTYKLAHKPRFLSPQPPVVLLHLSTSEFGLCGEVAEGGVVGVDGELGSIEVVAPGAEGMDDRQQASALEWISSM